MMYGRTLRPAYPGYLTQTYRIGDHAYSTGGSEAQRPPNRTTECKLPHQWLTEHKKEVAYSLSGQGLAMTDRASARSTNAQTALAAKAANERSTLAIAQKMAFTDGLKGELSAEAAAVTAELALLKESMDATMAAIDSKKAPLAAIAAWHAKRGLRYATERLCDPVKHDLETMMATLKESVRLLESALSAQQSEFMRLQVKKQALDADIVDKTSGLAVDTSAKAMSVDNRPTTAPVRRRHFRTGDHRRGLSSSPARRVWQVATLSARMVHPPMMSALHAPYDPKMWQQSSKTICDEARKVVQVKSAPTRSVSSSQCHAAPVLSASHGMLLLEFFACQVSKRLRETSSLLIAKREAAELEVYNEIVRDYANSIASIKAVIAATAEQIAACETEMGAIDGQVSVASASFADKQTAMSVAAERLSMRATRPARELVQDPAQRALGNECATAASNQPALIIFPCCLLVLVAMKEMLQPHPDMSMPASRKAPLSG